MTTLKSLVDETTNIKNEIVECHSNLSSILTSKNVEVSEEDKMSDLINKVDKVKITSLDTINTFNDAIFYCSDFVSTKSATLIDYFTYISKFNGIVKIILKTSAMNLNYSMRVVVYKNEEIILDNTFSPSSAYKGTEISKIIDITSGDTIKVQGCSPSEQTVYFRGSAIMCDFKIM